jgi:hypothetical protein
MAISRLAISNPGATTDTLLHTATRSSLASIIATNKANTVAEVRVWIVPQGQDSTPANWSYIAYDADITATNSLETFRFPVMSGDKIYVRSTTADVSFQIMGIYETGADTYVYAQATQPTAPQVGDIWVDTASDVPSIDNTTVYRWSKTAVGGETSLSGTGNDLAILKYIAGYEQVYLNGVLLAKTLDYTATNGTSITSLTALSAGDIVEVISPYAIELTDVYTKSVSDNKYFIKSSNPSVGEASTVNINTKPWNMPWGRIAYNEVVINDTSVTTEETQIISSSFTAVANRLYKITYFEPDVFNATAGSYAVAKIRLTNSSGTVINSAFTQTETAGVTNAYFNLQAVTALTAGATTLVGTLVWNAGAGYAARNSTSKAFLLVEDIGAA